MAKPRYYTLFLFVVWIAVNGDGPINRPVSLVPALKAEIIRISPEDNRDFFLLDVPHPQAGEDILSYWNGKQHRLMINGGYFNPDFSPTGYCKIKDKIIHPHISPSLSGYITLDKNGRLSLLTSKDNLAPYPTVLQNGPFLIDPGGRVGIHSRVGKEAARTVIGRTEDDTIVILVTAPIDLYDLARAVKRTFPEMERMLNLDGGPSAALKTRNLEIRNLAPVRNYLVQAAR